MLPTAFPVPLSTTGTPPILFVLMSLKAWRTGSSSCTFII
uniref:AMP-activated protein kinase gamma regulatory subunit n=1 Tax=Rhizophora mucronata TaxID=61149 RepID=A0A2P2QNU7_RHIMU